MQFRLISQIGVSVLFLIISTNSWGETMAKSLPFGDKPDWESKKTSTPGSVSWADLNNDGFLDLAVATYFSGGNYDETPNSVFFSKNGVLPTEPNWIAEKRASTNELLLTDFNNDQLIDMLTVGLGHSSLFVNSKVGLPTVTEWISEPLTSSFHVAHGDVNNDSFVDFFIVNMKLYDPWDGYPVHGYISNNQMVDQQNVWTSDYIIQGRGIAMGDIDNDGLTKSFLRLKGDGVQQLFRISDPNLQRVESVMVDGTSTQFSYVQGSSCITIAKPARKSTTTNILITYLTSSAVDLAVLNKYGPINIHMNNFGEISTSPDITVSAFGLNNKLLKLVDIDNDGDLDIFAGGQTTPMILFKNLGNSFEKSPSWKSDDLQPSLQAAVFGDVDNDGDLDMVTAHFASSAGIFRYYENAGSGLKTTPSWVIPWYGRPGTAVTLADVNMDGKLDLTIGAAGDTVKIFYNKLK